MANKMTRSEMVQMCIDADIPGYESLSDAQLTDYLENADGEFIPEYFARTATTKISHNAGRDRREGKTMNTTTTNEQPAAPPLPAFETLAYTMSRETVIALCVERLGKAPPKSWNRTEMAKALHGRSEKRSSYAKLANTVTYVEKMRCEPTKSWSAAKIAMATDTGKAPGGRAGKASAVAAYIAATGCEPTKSWSAQTCLNNIAADKRPGGKGNGPTVATMRQWLKNHNVPKRSTAKVKADVIALCKASFINLETGELIQTVALVAA